MTRAEMVRRIMALGPCYSRKLVEYLAKHWPEDVDALWLLENERRGNRVVSAADRVWLGCHLLPRDVVVRFAEACAIRVVNTRAAHALGGLRLTARAAALAAICANEASDGVAERVRQVAELARLAREVTP